MKTSVRWSETSDAVKGIRPPINSICYSPSGDYVVATCGVRILVYAATAGTLLHSLQGHTNTAYCVDYAHDGKIFASGGADRTVIIWSNKAEGILKYSHKDAIQALAFNPTCNQLCSVSSSDWGVWATDVPNVGKTRLPSKGLCAAWTQDGQNLAIGTMDGTILVFSKGETEKLRIRRNAPVWTLAFSPLRESGVDVLAVGSWDQKLSFYNLSGNAVFKERNLDYDPCSISFFQGGEYILIGGSHHKVTLYTKDGNRLVEVAHAEDWVWSAQQHPKLKQICCGTNDGTISAVDVTVTTVHTFYSDQYIYRENMTNVVVHQLTLDRRMIIPCNDYVQKLSTYRDRLAVQFEERVVVFELFFDDERNMRYQDVAQIRQHIECNSICVTSNMLIFCKERRMSLYDLQGAKVREWSMDSPIRFAKLIGGDEDAETVLVGLKNGQALKIFIDNPFPTLLVKVSSPIRCLDLNCMRTLLSVVDENNILKVFNLNNKNEVLFQENSVNVALWNTDFEDMLAYNTTNNVLNIKTSTLPAFQQQIRGNVVGFKANRLFNLHNTNLSIIDIPHSHALYHYIEAKDFDKAFDIASRGVADVDWKMLGLHAMTEMNLDIARKAFTQIREVKFVELLHALELNRRQAGDSKEKDDLLLADILAFQGKYNDAARKFIKCNNESRAIEMYCDLKMWDEAKKVCSDEKLLKNLIRQQAHWAEDSENYVEAASLYEACGDFAKAISMMGQGGQVDKLLATCRKLPKSEVALISECAHYFKQHNNIPYAIEAFEKVGDNRSLIQIYVDAGDWKNAFTIIEKCPQYAREVYVPWAGWLGENDMFEEALEAFRAARWPKEAIRMMETLASNSVVCRKFRDAAFYLVHLADEYGTFDDDEEPSEALKAARIILSNDCVRRGEIYYAFSTIFTSATQPFVFNETTLFRQSKYVLAMVSEGNVPMNVGKAEILYTLGRVAGRLEMIRTARVVFEKLQSVILPLNIMEQVDVETLMLRSRNFTDREDLLDTCYRCKQVVPQLTNAGDRCPNCYHPFVRCFVTFTALPLVELAISNDLTDEEAERIVVSGIGGAGKPAGGNEVNEDGTAVEKAGNEWQAADTGANVINFEDDNLDYQIDQQLIAMGRTKATANKTGDPFFAQLQFITRPGKPKDVYQPFMVNGEMLKTFRRDEIFIVKQTFGDLHAPNRYYRLMNRDFSITLCKGCQHFFIGDEYEMECMKGNGCPLCRFKPSRQVNRSLKEIMLATEMESNPQ